MSKSINKCFRKKLTFEKILEAHLRACKGKLHRKEIILFEMDLETNLVRILKELKDGTYQFGKYREFIVMEPKERIIKSLPYRDRIVHQWYIEEFIKPYMASRFIVDTFACIDGGGTHKAVIKTQKYMRRMQKKYGKYIVLKCDIKKYFYSIDKKILIEILKNYIRDKELLLFTKKILDDGTDIGIPIGNYTSQFFANIYLNGFDHYIKEELRVKYYIRYMDDFVILVPDKETAKELKEKIERYLNEKLHLELNKKSKYYPSTLGINFCGYLIYESHILLRKRFKKKIKRKINNWYKLKKENNLNKHEVLLSWNSLKAHASHADSYNFMCLVAKKMIDKKLDYCVDLGEFKKE